ncbi:hypothetical protein K492DRAFT_186959 [Lichtheimia hyalospora FSU 10163]|nr:hypothetical protein K492DRAFT_186959 [Lichtheimia hyalospora FSU 10163]
MTREIKANWNPDIHPMGVSPEQVLVGWLQQPGNFDRFRRAKAKKKANTIGASGESRLDVARNILVLLQNAGFEEYRAHGIVIKLGYWINKYNVARRLATSGASEAQVEQAFSYYYQLVDHVENHRRVLPNADSLAPSTSTSMASTQDSFSTSRESTSLQSGPLVEYSVREPSGDNIIQEQRRPVSRYARDGAPVISGAGS